MVGVGAVVLFTNRTGTPTGIVAPVIKIHRQSTHGVDDGTISTVVSG